VGGLKVIAAVAANEDSQVVHRYISSAKNKGFSVKQGAGYFVASGGHQPRERGPGDAHALRGGVLIEFFEIGQAQGLQLVESELDLSQGVHRDAVRLERGHAGLATDKAAFVRSGH
jgi:hypothetical protein